MPQRVSHGSDRLVERDGGYELVCNADKGWVGRRERGALQRHFAGSCVNWDDELFEVVSVERSSTEVRYRLVPWDPSHTIRVMEHYSDDAEAFRAADRRDVGARESHRILAIATSVLLGHLPGRVQEWMELEWGAPARLMTVVSAVPMLLLGGAGLILFMARNFGVAFGAGFVTSIPQWLLLLGPVVFIESMIRISAILGGNRPMGSLAGVVLYEIWHAVARRGPSRDRATESAPVDRRIVIQDRYDLLEPCLALLQPAEQKLLEHRFGFAPVHWGKRTAWVLMIASLPLLIPSVMKTMSGTASGFDLIMLVVSGGLMGEQIARLRKLSRGLPAGSLLGGAIRPFARIVLRDTGR